ncbi:hypothetical protein VIGAN_08122600 [Vigna angularis var. angularis]|uniref:Uncharacterized protein n=1 Tax=Vigna angularis var. angularis TaxID=157739 RepID=A0A0S3SP55_PHAAN|nr:hypothetical protein VIGAN_08122600 [Vigna angularis var. angularis]
MTARPQASQLECLPQEPEETLEVAKAFPQELVPKIEKASKLVPGLERATTTLEANVLMASSAHEVQQPRELVCWCAKRGGWNVLEQPPNSREKKKQQRFRSAATRCPTKKESIDLSHGIAAAAAR